MKTLILLLFPVFCFGQNINKNNYRLAVTKNDIAVMSLQFAAGYGQGWREEVLYHPNALFRRFPNLNRSFWDSRQWKRHNANHWLKTGVVGCQTLAIVIKIGERKKNWKAYAIDMIKYYGSYKLGFFAAYNITHKNKFTF